MTQVVGNCRLTLDFHSSISELHTTSSISHEKEAKADLTPLRHTKQAIMCYNTSELRARA